jgi:hypothetical protein
MICSLAEEEGDASAGELLSMGAGPLRHVDDRQCNRECSCDAISTDFMSRHPMPHHAVPPIATPVAGYEAAVGLKPTEDASGAAKP